MKRNQLVNIERQMLASTLAASLPNFIFWNSGKVAKVAGDRIYVRWNKADAYWFDSEAVRAADRAVATLSPRDFVYVYEPGVGQTYQNGPYLIGVGRNTYSCNYRGQCFSWGLSDFLSAIEACAKHQSLRQAQEAP